MQIVEAIADADVLDAGRRNTYRLAGGEQYVVYDSEAALGMGEGALILVAGLDRMLPVYARQPLGDQRLILPFIGRGGDAIAVASCVAALVEKYPGVTVDIASPAAAREAFGLMPRFGDLLPYPLEAGRLANYDFHLSLEEVEAVPRGTEKSCANLFSACMTTPTPVRTPRAIIPGDALQRRHLPPASRPRVGLHVGDPDNLRSYPGHLLQELLGHLTQAAFEVYLIGVGDSVEGIPATEIQNVHNLIGRTPTLADLAAVLSQMDAVITNDSLPLHLAGALNVPAIAVFTVTDSVIATDYPSIRAIQSRAECSPCHTPLGVCPLGHDTCIAHQDTTLAPLRLMEWVENLTAASIRTNQSCVS